MTMERAGTNPIVPDFVMGQVWRDSVPDVTNWNSRLMWSNRRYGHLDRAARSACSLLATAFRSAGQTGDFLAEWPQFYVKGRAYRRPEPIAPYDEHLLVAASIPLAAAPTLGGNDAYRYDVVNLTRQALAQLGLPLVNRRTPIRTAAVEAHVEGLLGDLDMLAGMSRSSHHLRCEAVGDHDRAVDQWGMPATSLLFGARSATRTKMTT